MAQAFTDRYIPEPGEWPCQTTADEALPPRLVAVLYTLLRDHVLPGDMEDTMIQCRHLEHAVYTNPYLEGYARALASYLIVPEEVNADV